MLGREKRFDELLAVTDVCAKLLADKAHIPAWQKGIHDWVASQTQ
jgi:hypothetical protein